MKLRDILRSETKVAHQRLDDFVGQMNIFDSTKKYCAFLIGMYRLYQAFGSEVDWAADQIGIAPSVYKLVSAIQSDGSFSADELRWTGPVNGLDARGRADDAATKWGGAYVLEGSAIGARYMVKAAGKMIAALEAESTPAIGSTYLQTLASDSYERWPKFVAALNQAECDPAVAVESATQVFVVAQGIFESLANELERVESKTGNQHDSSSINS